jgi:hypothetical protein
MQRIGGSRTISAPYVKSSHPFQHVEEYWANERASTKNEQKHGEGSLLGSRVDL